MWKLSIKKFAFKVGNISSNNTVINGNVTYLDFNYRLGHFIVRSTANSKLVLEWPSFLVDFKGLPCLCS